MIADSGRLLNEVIGARSPQVGLSLWQQNHNGFCGRHPQGPLILIDAIA
jgi:hypothetical protein